MVARKTKTASNGNGKPKATRKPKRKKPIISAKEAATLIGVPVHNLLQSAMPSIQRKGSKVYRVADCESLVNRDQAARKLNVASGTLANWASDGCGPKVIKFGILVFYRLADLDQWLRDQEVRNVGVE